MTAPIDGDARAAMYRSTLAGVTLVADLVENLELDEALEIAQSADTLGPMLVPTEWIRGNQNTTDAKALLKPLIAFRNAAREIRDRTPIQGGQAAGESPR